MANGKAAGPDGIIVKTLEAPDDFWYWTNNPACEQHNYMLKIISSCRCTDHSSQETRYTTKCNLHRTISPISQIPGYCSQYCWTDYAEGRPVKCCGNGEGRLRVFHWLRESILLCEAWSALVDNGDNGGSHVSGINVAPSHVWNVQLV